MIILDSQDSSICVMCKWGWIPLIWSIKPFMKCNDHDALLNIFFFFFFGCTQRKRPVGALAPSVQHDNDCGGLVLSPVGPHHVQPAAFVPFQTMHLAASLVLTMVTGRLVVELHLHHHDRGHNFLHNFFFVVPPTPLPQNCTFLLKAFLSRHNFNLFF